MRKFLTTLLCLIMVFTMMPMATGVAFARELNEFSVGEVQVVTGGNVTNPTGANWEYVTGTDVDTLYLKGGEVGAIEYGLARPLNIVVTSDTNITSDAVAINICGDGAARIIIEDDITFTLGTSIEAASLTDEKAYKTTLGLETDHTSASITNKGILNIYAQKGIVLGSDCDGSLNLDLENDGIINVYSLGDCISGSAMSLSIQGGEMNLYNSSSGYGIYADATTLTNLKTKIESKMMGIAVGHLTIEGDGSTEVEAPIAIYTAGNINLLGGKVTATGTYSKNVPASSGIYAMGTLYIASDCNIKVAAIATKLQQQQFAY